MMKIIAHRGNISGPQPENENKFMYLQAATKAGFDVEVDVWYDDGGLRLGHDSPGELIYDGFLQRPAYWVHAKNFEAADYLRKMKNVNFFWHQNDDFAMTSQGFFWTYPGKALGEKSIAVLPESIADEEYDPLVGYGICTDYANYYKMKVLEKRYRYYIECCEAGEWPCISMAEFANEVANGKCELCLVFDSPNCDCKKSDI